MLIIRPLAYNNTSLDSVKIIVHAFKQSSIVPQTVMQVKRYAPDGFDYDIQGNLAKTDSLPLQIADGLLKEGTQVFIFHSKSAVITLPADTLWKMLGTTLTGIGAIDNLSEQALVPVVVHQNAKLILQQGSRFSENCSSNTTLPFEIVPEKHLFLAGKQKITASFSVLFKGQPAAHAQVTLWHRESKNEEFVPVVLSTGKNGVVKTSVVTSGEYIITSLKVMAGQIVTLPVQLYYTTTSWGY